MISTSAFNRDANGVPITQNGLIALKAITYVGNASGDVGETTLFTVTGAVVVRVFGICGLTLVGAATLEVGISGDTAVIIAQVANATTIATGEFYMDATAALQVEALPAQLLISNGQDIIQTIGSVDLTGGQMTYYCLWSPISSTGDVVAA